MTLKELAALEVGTAVKYGEDEGEIVQSGRIAHIMWADCTSVINTDKQVWEELVSEIEVQDW